MDNGVPCVCIYTYMVAFASTEVVMFLSCLVILFIANVRKKQRIDKKAWLLFSLFSLAFFGHYSFVLYSYAGETHCRKIVPITSYICFLPQAIYFQIFIWVIFKLLVVWRVMVANSHDQQEMERKRL